MYDVCVFIMFYIYIHKLILESMKLDLICMNSGVELAFLYLYTEPRIFIIEYMYFYAVDTCIHNT